MVTPLSQKNKQNETLQRLPRVETEIAEALALTPNALLERAALAEQTPGALSSECLVYLIRADLLRPNTPMLELLLPVLLARCAANLRRTVRGFKEPTLSMVHEEILGELALLLIEPSSAADFYEVRFWLAFARLRIDTCHRYKRHDDRLVFVDEIGVNDDRPDTILETGGAYGESGLDPERACILQDALGRLDAEERKIYALFHLVGIPINGGKHNLVTLTGLSERTVRNRLRGAEQTLETYKERVI